nr:putative ribonuclease H-like domain-containing protein [Tanacetum cinerariifolium]
MPDVMLAYHDQWNPKGGKITGKGKIRTDTKCIILSSDFKLPDENHLLLRVLRENNMYNVDLKNVVPLGDLTCLFSKATLEESNLLHRRLCHINFKKINKLVKGNLVRGLPSKVFENNHTCVACKKGKQHRASCKSKLVSSISQPLRRPINQRPAPKNSNFHQKITTVNTKKVNTVKGTKGNWIQVSHGLGPQKTLSLLFDVQANPQQALKDKGIQGNFNAGKVRKETEFAQQYVLLPLWYTGSKDPQNTYVDAAFDDKENEYAVYVSPNSSDKPKKHDEKDRREAKGKSHVDLSTGVRDLSDEFEEFFVNSTHRVNAASAPVTTVGPNLTNSTNSFKAVGPFDTVVSLNFEISGKSSFVDLSQYHDDPDTPTLEDIIYSDDEEDVGAEADFFNLETSVTVSLIPTTRVHKDHPITQIIGDLFSAPQTMSMTRMVKEQGGLTQINDEDFHTCMFACFLSQEEPKRVHQALKHPSWIEAMRSFFNSRCKRFGY